MENLYVLSITTSMILIDDKYSKEELIFAFSREFGGEGRITVWDAVDCNEQEVTGTIAILVKIEPHTDLEVFMGNFLEENKGWTSQECFGVYTLEAYFKTPKGKELLTEKDF